MDNKYFKSSLMLGVAMAGFAAAAPVQAQDAEGASSGGDIIVTARRVEERLQDVPISMTVYSQEDISKRNIVLASDLATYTPSLTINQRFGPEKSSYALRGFNQDQNTAATVGVYFADVVGVRVQGGTNSGNTLPAGSFIDLQNVQVLKGPQGTLFGRNTTGGAVLLVPQKPTDNLEGYIEGSIGNYDMRRVQGVLNLPLADTFKVRIAVDRNKRDGYIKNQSGIGPDRYNDQDYLYARLSILAELTPDLENYTVFHYGESNTNGVASRIERCDRDFVALPESVNPRFVFGGAFPNTRLAIAGAACDQLDRAIARGDGKLTADVDFENPYLKLDTWQAINTTTWDVSDTLTVKNIISYGEYRERSAFSNGFSNFYVPDEFAGYLNVGEPFTWVELQRAPGLPTARESTFTEELQFQGQTADSKFTYVVGGYLEKSRPIGWNGSRAPVYLHCNALELDCNAALGVGFVSESLTKYSFDNMGIFAQGTYNFTDQLALTAGIRYTDDKIVGVSESNRFTFAAIPNVGTIPVARGCNDGLRFPGVSILASGDTSQCHVRLVEKSSKPTWLINLDYKPTPDVLLYAKYSRGYRQGGMVFTNPGLETWGPEKLESYEAGAKTTFRGANVNGYFNVSAFYNDFTDQQIITRSVAKPASGVAGGNVIANAGVTEIYGLEVDAAATLFERLKLSLGYTYLHTKIKEFVLPVLPADSPFARLEQATEEGGPLTYSPKHRLTASASYTLPLDESVGEISIGATFTHTAKQIADGLSPIGVLPSTDLLNLNLDWKRVADTDFDLALFATNITNEIYPVSVGSLFSSNGYENLTYGQPRMYGVRVRFNFGQ